MNKQEVIEKLKSEARHHCGEKECYKYGCTKNIELDIAIDIVNQIDELKKPVIPQFVADWIERHKRNVSSLKYLFTDNQDKELQNWLMTDTNQELMALAWIYGYEVKKEKLYTARLKIMKNTESGYVNKSATEFFISDSTNSSEYKTRFTQSELEEMELWDNPAFEIKEVKK